MNTNYNSYPRYGSVDRVADYTKYWPIGVTWIPTEQEKLVLPHIKYMSLEGVREKVLSLEDINR